MIGQTVALLIDAYRHLRARKLFWIVLALSCVFVLGFAAIGNNERGITLLVWDVPLPMLSTTVLDRPTFYKFVFVVLGFQFWLTWAATILALVSTAGIIPEFVASGSIELVLARPIGRVRLFVTKYATGLLFVTLQVALFSVASFLVIGIRGGAWVPAIFLAVPLVVAFFSYLYAVSALVGLLTRSAIAALLVTILFWFVIFLAQSTESMMLQFRVLNEQAAAVLEGEINAASSHPDRRADEADLDYLRSRLTQAQDDADRWRRFHAISYAVMTVLPKTSQTMELLRHLLISQSDMDAMIGASQPAGATTPVHGVRISARTVSQLVEAELRRRTPVWVVGTSLLFEAAVVGWACLVFARRDF